MNLLRFFISLVEVDLPIQNHGVFLSFIKNPLSRKLNFVQNKGSRDFFKNDREHRLLSSFEKRFNRGNSWVCLNFVFSIGINKICISSGCRSNNHIEKKIKKILPSNVRFILCQEKNQNCYKPKKANSKEIAIEKSCNPFSNRFCFVITKRFQGFLRGMFIKLIGGTFNLNHFHGDRIWSAFCASIFCALSLTAAEANAQVGAAAAVAAAAAATSANSALYSSRSRQEDYRLLPVVNHMGAIDLSNKKICIVPRGSYLKVNNCRRGDVIVIEDGTLSQIMEVCKLDEPVYSYKGAFACAYEDHEKKLYSAADKKRSAF